MQLGRTDLAAGPTIVGEHGPVPRNNAPTKVGESQISNIIIILTTPSTPHSLSTPTDGRIENIFPMVRLTSLVCS